MTQKGFTLIELLVVIAILAVLAAVVVLTLNPAELLRQARDSTRISDLATLNSALGLYLADQSSPTLAPSYVTCMQSASSTLSANDSTCGFTSAHITANAASSSALVDGTGWLSVDFTSISGGSPLGALPLDPSNTGDNVYRYAASSTQETYELNAVMESTKFANTGGDDVESTDGGNDDDIYEVGNQGGLTF